MSVAPSRRGWCLTAAPRSASPGPWRSEPDQGVSARGCLVSARGGQHLRWARGAFDQMTPLGPGDCPSPIIRSRRSRPGIRGLEFHCPHFEGLLRPEANCPLFTLLQSLAPRPQKQSPEPRSPPRRAEPFHHDCQKSPGNHQQGLLTAD